MMTISKIVPVALAALALGCSSSATVGPDSGTDADADSDTDSDADGGADLWSWVCPSSFDEVCGETNSEPWPYSPVLDAADLGLSFVHASRSPRLILAEREIEAGTEPVAVTWGLDLSDTTVVGVIDPPAGMLRAVDVGSPRRLDYNAEFGFYPNDEHFGYVAAALLCGEAECGLYKLALDEELEPLGLEAIPGGEVPIDEPRAMTWVQTMAGDDGFDPGRICVAGDGVACFDGESWDDTWEPGGGMLNAIVVELIEGELPTDLWVAGENGFVATGRDGEWAEIDSGTSMDFTAISAHDGVWAAGGVGGFAFGDAEHAITCESGAATTTTFVRESYIDDETIFALTALAESNVVEIAATSEGIRACTRPADFSGEPRNADYFPGCADAICAYAVAPGGLYQRVEYYTGVE